MLYDFNSINHPKLMGAHRSCGQLSFTINEPFLMYKVVK
jgi:hypothetical protein